MGSETYKGENRNKCNQLEDEQIKAGNEEMKEVMRNKRIN